MQHLASHNTKPSFAGTLILLSFSLALLLPCSPALPFSSSCRASPFKERFLDYEKGPGYLKSSGFRSVYKKCEK